jgi:hypothetical protein
MPFSWISPPKFSNSNESGKHFFRLFLIIYEFLKYREIFLVLREIYSRKRFHYTQEVIHGSEIHLESFDEF